jgi:hypothetical protein
MALDCGARRRYRSGFLAELRVETLKPVRQGDALAAGDNHDYRAPRSFGPNVSFSVFFVGSAPESRRGTGDRISSARGRVGMWRGGGRIGLSVSAPLVWRCLNSRAMTPFPHPAHRTGRALLTHPALGQDITPSHTEGHEQPSDQPPGPWHPSVLRSTRLLATAKATT